MVAAETLNFSEAARRLHMSQPSVSQHIRSLEEQFSVRLFVRAGRHVHLTDAGLALVPLARDVVRRSVLIEETMRSLEGEVYGHLVVGCSTTPGKYLLPTLLARFHHLHPRVTVSCQVAPQGQTVDMVCDGNAQFLMASAPYINCRDVEFRRFTTDPLVLIAPADHPWARRGQIEPEELYGGDYIMREDGAGTLATVRDGLAGLGIAYERLRTLIVLGNPEAIALAVQEGLGVGFVSNIVIDKLVLDGVRVVKVRGLELERDIFIGRHASRAATAAQSAFWEFATGPGKMVQMEEVLPSEPLLVAERVG
jgi:DNA-binding transcriptional LysR family regulator